AAELDGVQDLAGKRREETLEPRKVLPVHLGRKLPEDRPQLVPEAQHELEVAVEPLPRLLEPLEMGEVAAPLASEEEALGRALSPAVDHGSGRKPVEGGVQLDGIEDLGEAREPALRRYPRIEQVLPVLVDVAARPDTDHAAKMLIPGLPRPPDAGQTPLRRCSPRRR